MGNEIYDGIPLRVDFQRIARKLDPARFFADSDGVWGTKRYIYWNSLCNGRSVLDPQYDRDTLALYFAQFDEIGDQVNNPAK